MYEKNYNLCIRQQTINTKILNTTKVTSPYKFHVHHFRLTNEKSKAEIIIIAPKKYATALNLDLNHR